MISNKILPTLIIVFLFQQNALAKQEKFLKDGDEVVAKISLTELSRIKVKGDKIASVKMNQGDLEILEDVKLGEIYVKPLSKYKDNISIFVITKKGKTFKLSLKPEDIGAEQIFINAKPKRLTDDKQTIDYVQVLKDIRQEYNAGKLNLISQPLVTRVAAEEFDIIKSINRDDYIIEILEHKNQNHFFLNFDSEEILKEQKGKWLAMHIDNPAPAIGEKTTLFVVKSR